MKIDQENKHVSSSGLEGATQFTINAGSSLMMELLSTGVYQQPELAVVRELFCNAWDAHIQAGTTDRLVDINFDIDNQLIIRDYGTGLSDEDMVGLYSTYGVSTKNGSNDFTGALGIGSKSPFSVADSFIVTSYFNGYKTDFFVFKDDKGFPSIKQVAKELNSSPSGLKIAITLKEEHQYKLERAVWDYATVFPDRISSNVEGVGSVDIQEGRIKTRMLRNSNLKAHNDKCCVIMGSAIYPVDTRVSVWSYSFTEWPKGFRKNNRGSFLFEVPIGKVDITASREGLRETPKTLEYIERAAKIAGNVRNKQVRKDYLALKEPAKLFLSNRSPELPVWAKAYHDGASYRWRRQGPLVVRVPVNMNRPIPEALNVKEKGLKRSQYNSECVYPDLLKNLYKRPRDVLRRLIWEHNGVRTKAQYRSKKLNKKELVKETFAGVTLKNFAGRTVAKGTEEMFNKEIILVPESISKVWPASHLHLLSNVYVVNDKWFSKAREVPDKWTIATQQFAYDELADEIAKEKFDWGCLELAVRLPHSISIEKTAQARHDFTGHDAIPMESLQYVRDVLRRDLAHEKKIVLRYKRKLRKLKETLNVF